jgi:hypothetical protein
MTLLKRAEPKLEERVLENAHRFLPDTSDLKVYLMLKPNGAFLKNSNGQVAMTLLTDNELKNELYDGNISLKISA